MAISNAAGTADSLDEFRSHLSDDASRAALVTLLRAASADPRFVLEAVPHGAISRTLKYMVGRRNPYAAIVNQSSLLFYFRKPSGQTTCETLGELLRIGLDASFNNSNEIRVRLGTESDAQQVLQRLDFGAAAAVERQATEMTQFRVGQSYTREQVIALAGDSPATGGAWFTGYREFDGAYFVFCGVGTGGRTGHDYGNRFDGDDLLWKGKTNSKKGQPLIDAMVASEATVHIFWRAEDRGPFTYAGLGAAAAVDEARPVGVRWRFKEPSGPKRWPVETLRRATPEFVFGAVEKLLAGADLHPFVQSTDYDLVADEVSRLPPKAVFGLALSDALGGAPVAPEHFTGGEGSACFRLLREAGYQVVPKGEPAAPETGDAEADEDAQWSEGKQRLVSHVRRERSGGLATAKKAQVRRLEGKLVCERCGCDPVAEYGTPDAEACIEVHHATTHIADMASGHRTRLADLQCLCANCHRLVHRLLRQDE